MRGAAIKSQNEGMLRRLVEFRKRIPDFRPAPDLLTHRVMLYRRGEGRLRSALDLPTTEAADMA